MTVQTLRAAHRRIRFKTGSTKEIFRSRKQQGSASDDEEGQDQGQSSRGAEIPADGADGCSEPDEPCRVTVRRPAVLSREFWMSCFVVTSVGPKHVLVHSHDPASVEIYGATLPIRIDLGFPPKPFDCL